MKREKKKVVKTPDEAGAKECLRDYCLASSSLKELEAQMEIEFNKIRDKHKMRIADLQEQKSTAMEYVHAYAEANRESLFSKKKSMDWGFGIVGFRTGTHKVAKKRGITWEAILDLMEAQGLPFIRTKKEVDKDRIIMSRDDESQMTRLGKVGISVIQDETFFIEVKEEELVNA